jgi:hypothetical protein
MYVNPEQCTSECTLPLAIYRDDEEVTPRITLLAPSTDLPNSTAELLDLGPMFVLSMKTIKKQIELNMLIDCARKRCMMRSLANSNHPRGLAYSNNKYPTQEYRTNHRTLPY